MLDKKQIQAIFLFEFKMGLKATETTQNINNAVGPGTANEHRVVPIPQLVPLLRVNRSVVLHLWEYTAESVLPEPGTPLLHILACGVLLWYGCDSFSTGIASKNIVFFAIILLSFPYFRAYRLVSVWRLVLSTLVLSLSCPSQLFPLINLCLSNSV